MKSNAVARLILTVGVVSVVATVAAVAGVAGAQERNSENTLALAGADPASAVIDDFLWLVGLWEGEAFGSSMQEAWSPPTGGTMAGTFKVFDDDQVHLYEFMVLVPVGNSVSLRLKHFGADLVGWEEKDGYKDFPLVRLTEDTAYFEGLTFARDGSDLINVYLVVGNDDGEESEEHLIYRRALPDRATTDSGSSSS